MKVQRPITDIVTTVLDDYALAAELVRTAGLRAAAMWRAGVATETKTSISDVVTAADRAAEAMIVEQLRARRPDDALVGEEGTDDPGLVAGGRTWFIDPVDGTYNFTRGLPMWCSAIALVDADGPVLGAIYEPSSDELWIGGRDHPATLNGSPVAVDQRPLSEVAIASYLHPTTLHEDLIRVPLLRAMGAAATVRMIGSGSVELAAVAGGRLGCFLQHGSLPWDWWPGAAIVLAAGGRAEVFEVDGVRWHVAGGAAAVTQAQALVRG